MHNRLLITKLPFSSLEEKASTEYTITALCDENRRVIEAHCQPLSAANLLDAIYIGRVKDIALNLNAAFIEIAPGQTCYYSLADLKQPIFTKKVSKKELGVGDEVVVQVIREGIKTKFPVVTTNLSFTGRYSVLTTENTRIGVSSKLRKDVREYYRSILEAQPHDDYGVIVRTNAAGVPDEEVLAELKSLQSQYQKLRDTCVHKTCFSCLRKAPASYWKLLTHQYSHGIEEILTDQPDICEDLRTHTDQLAELGAENIRLYEDASYPLDRLYHLRGQLEDARKERVWLKSGAYLIIQPTEALTVIDVNSGKNVAKKNPQENFYRINLEAADMIADQLRLRNISGIILVDFINLDSKEATDELMHALRMRLKEDTIPTSLIDMTKLGLVEITRKKEYRSLREQLSGTAIEKSL